MSKSTTREIIDRIFKEPGIKYELTEFETLGKPIHEILDIQARTVDTGRDAGKIKYFLKSQVPFSSGKEEVQVYVDDGKNHSGNYEYRVDEDGHLVEFPDGHPQEGQLVVGQDLVNYDLAAADLADAGKIPKEKLCVAEAFVRFAQEQGLDF